MCGIVGYVGKRTAVPVLLEGLKRVEYRGYDSAGIAILDTEGQAPVLAVHKQAGKISALSQRLRSAQLFDHPAMIGIAHTRWATHGNPTDENAHPHLSCRGHVAVVHNGIIENFTSLRQELLSRDHNLRTETDSEVLAHLIGEFLNGDPMEAVRSALALVEGTYGIAVLFRDFPDRIIVARNGSPLCVGIGEQEHFVASDPASFLKFTRRSSALEDGQICCITADNEPEIRDFENVPVSQKVETLEMDLAEIEKGGYDHFMLKEICEQPQSLSRTISGRLDHGRVVLGGLFDQQKLLKGVGNIVFAAAGTSLNASMIGRILIQEISELPAQCENASELANQMHPLFPPNSLVWAITQSGETKDLLLAIAKAEELSLPVFGLCNVVGSSVAKKTLAGVYVNAGPEIGVASTKAFTSQVILLNIISCYLRRLRGLPDKEWTEQYLNDIRAIPGLVQGVIDQREQIREIVLKYARYRNFLFLGRGINYPVAMEGALKLKEISYVHAEGYSTGEMKHGPLAMIDDYFPTVVIAPKKDRRYRKIINNIQEIRARGQKGPAPVLALANVGDDEIAQYVDDVIYVPRTTYYLTPLLFVVPLQLLAYYIAVELGQDVDQPRNLAKSVTVE